MNLFVYVLAVLAGSAMAMMIVLGWSARGRVKRVGVSVRSWFVAIVEFHEPPK